MICKAQTGKENMTEEELKKVQGKKSFIFHKALEHDLEAMTAEEVKYFMQIVFDFVSRGEIHDLTHPANRAVRVAFNRFYADYVRDSEAWISSIKQKSEAGKKSAAVRAEKSKS